MTPKAYLSQVRDMEVRINAKLEQVWRLRAQASRCTSTLTGMPRGSGGGSRVEEIVARYVELEQEIDASVDRMMALRREVEQVIAAVPNPTHRTLLELRYLNGWTWRMVADKLGQPESTVRGRLHHDALRSLHYIEYSA